MPNTAAAPKALSSYFSMSQARADRWRTVHRLARTLAGGTPRPDETRDRIVQELAGLAPIEELCAYPGPRLLTVMRERLQTSDYQGVERLAQRISISLLSNSYRDDAEAWRSDEDEAHTPDALPPGIGQASARKPYLEVLVVTPGERATWQETREAFRRLRREGDAFVYEPVVVGSFEDAVLAAIVNYNIQSVVIYDGFQYPAQSALPDLREILASFVPAETAADADLGTLLSRVLHAYRPELDIYLMTDRNATALAGSDEAACIRRVARSAPRGISARDPPKDRSACRSSSPNS